MLVKVWIINAILALAVLFIGVNIHGALRRDSKVIEQQNSPPDDLPAKSARMRILKRGVEPASAYKVIAGKNLFAPNRRESEPRTDAAGEKPLAPAVSDLRASNEKVVLYGVVVMNNVRKALILHPTATEKNDREQRWVSAGDRLGALTVDGIEKDRIYLSGDSKRYELLLYNKDKAASDAYQKETPNPQATIIQTSPVAPKKTDITPFTTSDKKAAAAPAVKNDDAEYEIIDSPFGKIKRKKRNL